MTSTTTPAPLKTHLELICDSVKKTGHEVTIKVTDANRDNLARIIDAVTAQGLDASTDGRHILIRKL